MLHSDYEFSMLDAVNDARIEHIVLLNEHGHARDAEEVNKLRERFAAFQAHLIVLVACAHTDK